MTNASKATCPFYAVRVVVTHDACGSTSSRDYVRGTMGVSKPNFVSFAVGDLLRLTTGGASASWTVEEISEDEVFTVF